MEHPAGIYRRIAFFDGRQMARPNLAKGTAKVQDIATGAKVSREEPEQAKGATTPSEASSVGQDMENGLWQRAAKREGDVKLVRDGFKRNPDSTVVPVVDADPGIPKFVGKQKTRALVNWLSSYFNVPKDVTIESNGEVIRISKSGLKASVKKERANDGHSIAYGPLKELINKSEYDHYEPVDSRHKGKNNGQDVYYAALRVEDRIYSVKLKYDVLLDSEIATRTRIGDRHIEDGRYKDHSLSEIEIAPTTVNAGFNRPVASAIDGVMLGFLRGNVNATQMKDGFLSQDVKKLINGQVRFNEGEGNYVVGLFRTANLSTLAHEMGLVYFLEMQRAVENGLADESMQKDYRKLCAYVGAKPGVRRTVEQHEKLARSWESYLREGMASSFVLEGAFAWFRQWLTKIYREILRLNVS